MTEQEQSEVQQLRAQVAALEAELVEAQARTNAVVAKWQERAYWLDRWHLDLNALMRRPGADRAARGAARRERRVAAQAAQAAPELATRARAVSVMIPVKDGERYLEELLGRSRARASRRCS